MRETKVVVLGGGVAGLTAAHELVEAAPGLDVHLYDASSLFGGKATSQFVPGTGRGGRGDLPGEHGFRFFPAWYTHVPDTMRRIPTGDGVTVIDRLVGSDQFGLADVDQVTVIPLPRHAPTSMGDMFHVVEALWTFLRDARVGLTDTGTFATEMLGYMLTCEERRLAQYEGLSFFEYLRGDRFTPEFQRYLNSSRFMVAMDARKGSARTIGDKVLQLLRDFRRPAGENDRVLNGPTSTQWLTPWVERVRALGVHLHPGRRVAGLELEGRRITGARVEGESEIVTADHFILAVPVEVARGLITDAMAEASSQLRRIRAAQNITDWMVGAQFFLREDVQLCNGHVAFPDSPWALSAISQAAFWKKGHSPTGDVKDRFGDGTVRGILSVDISDWTVPGSRTRKTARECGGADEVLDEVWHQLKEGVNAPSQALLRDDVVVARHLDTSISFGPEGASNRSPLLVHPPGSWAMRPTAAPDGIENLFLAADYVQTTTDLASMEGASEAARMAVNALLDRAGVGGKRADVFPLKEDMGRLVEFAKGLDRERFRRDPKGKPLPIVARRALESSAIGIDEALEYEREVEKALREAYR